MMKSVQTEDLIDFNTNAPPSPASTNDNSPPKPARPLKKMPSRPTVVAVPPTIRERRQATTHHFPSYVYKPKGTETAPRVIIDQPQSDKSFPSTVLVPSPTHGSTVLEHQRRREDDEEFDRITGAGKSDFEFCLCFTLEFVTKLFGDFMGEKWERRNRAPRASA